MSTDRPRERVILEMGSGTSLHGRDYTKAAVRAVDDALHHSSLGFMKALGIPFDEMIVDVTIGVQQPDRVDRAAVAAKLPHGQVTVNTVFGGLDVANTGPEDVTVIASAAIAVYVDMRPYQAAGD